MKQRGDTLIEVLFGFIILGVVVSVAFSGALTSYRSVVSAQNRTQATYAVEYQAEALKTYRQSQEYSGSYTNFLTNIGLASSTSSDFCMKKDDVNLVWIVIFNPASNCGNVAKSLAPNLINPSLSITSIKSTDVVTATIRLEWDNRNGQRDNVVNTVVLTRGIGQ